MALAQGGNLPRGEMEPWLALVLVLVKIPAFHIFIKLPEEKLHRKDWFVFPLRVIYCRPALLVNALWP